MVVQIRSRLQDMAHTATARKSVMGGMTGSQLSFFLEELKALRVSSSEEGSNWGKLFKSDAEDKESAMQKDPDTTVGVLIREDKLGLSEGSDLALLNQPQCQRYGSRWHCQVPTRTEGKTGPA